MNDQDQESEAQYVESATRGTSSKLSLRERLQRKVEQRKAALAYNQNSLRILEADH